MKRTKGFIFILISASLWGLTGLYVTTLRNSFGIESMNILVIRAFFTVIQLGLFMFFYDKSLFKIKLKDLWLFGATGILSITFFCFCYYQTMKYTTLSVAAVLMYTAPIFVMVISIIFLGEKFTFLKTFCCISTIVGCAFVTGALSSAQSIGSKGIIYGVLTAFGYSLYGIFSSMLIKRGYNSFTINFYAFVFVFVSSCVVINRGLANTVSLYCKGYMPLVIIILMALFNTVLPYILYSSGLKTVSPSIAIIIATVEPVVATLVDIVKYNKYPDIYGYFGIFIVLSSVLLLNLFGGKNEAKSQCENQSDS